MLNHTVLPAKAITNAEQSNAIVVSFASKWHQQLLARDFSLVIRKRVPTNRAFDWLYFHINSPAGAICGRARIKRITTLTLENALARASKISLSREEIQSYLAGDRHIGCYELGEVQFGKKQVHTTELATRMIYHPPQSFFILSKLGKQMVDQMAGFTELKAGHSRKAREK